MSYRGRCWNVVSPSCNPHCAEIFWFVFISWWAHLWSKSSLSYILYFLIVIILLLVFKNCLWIMKSNFSKVCELLSTSMFSKLFAGYPILQVKCRKPAQYMNKAEATARVPEPLQQCLPLMLFLRQFWHMNRTILVAYIDKHLFSWDSAELGCAYLSISPSVCPLGSIL